MLSFAVVVSLSLYHLHKIGSLVSRLVVFSLYFIASLLFWFIKLLIPLLCLISIRNIPNKFYSALPKNFTKEYYIFFTLVI